MLAIANRAATVRQANFVAIHPAHRTKAAGPSMQPRASARPPAGWTREQFRSYYFDAAHHTALTLRELLRACKPGAEPLGVRPNSELLQDAMHSLMASVCPRIEDDFESRSYFNELLSMHLSGLDAVELRTLSSCLKDAGFDGVVSESFWTDAVYEDFGFANGPLSERQRTLMLPEDWKCLLAHLTDEVSASEKRLQPSTLPNPAELRFARHCLGHAAQQWASSDKLLTTFGQICEDLCGAFGLSTGPGEMTVAKGVFDASTVDWREGRLVLDVRAYAALLNDRDGRMINYVLRDLLEAVLARRMFGSQGQPLRLSSANRMLLYRTIDDIAAQPPSLPSAAMRDAAERLIAQSPRFGKVQVMPLTGVALGHVWIGNVLSVTPDRTQRPTAVGTRYLHAGGRLHADKFQVNEWPIRWLTPRENEDLYPPQHAWHITVPVPVLTLQQSAARVAQDWKERKLGYRFVGAEPGLPSQGCRASVIAAVEQGMDDEARALFAHFNAGLAEPDSPTDVALRMNRFMQWLRQLAVQPVSS